MSVSSNDFQREGLVVPAAGPAGGPTTVPDGGRPAVTAMDG